MPQLCRLSDRIGADLPHTDISHDEPRPPRLEK